VTFLRWQILCSDCHSNSNDPDSEQLSGYMDEAFAFGNSMVFYQWSEEDEDGDEDLELNFAYNNNNNNLIS
jgi:hypothetical protein